MLGNFRSSPVKQLARIRPPLSNTRALHAMGRASQEAAARAEAGAGGRAEAREGKGEEGSFMCGRHPTRATLNAKSFTSARVGLTLQNRLGNCLGAINGPISLPRL